MQPAWRSAPTPTTRYTIRDLGPAKTEALVREVYGILPAEWRLGRDDSDRINRAICEIADRIRDEHNREEEKYVARIRAAYPRSTAQPRLWDCWDARNIVFRAERHLRNIGVIEMVRRSPSLYRRHPLPADPLLKPSRSRCVRGAAEIVDRSRPVDDTHVAVPQQTMRGLLSGALVR